MALFVNGYATLSKARNLLVAKGYSQVSSGTHDTRIGRNRSNSITNRVERQQPHFTVLEGNHTTGSGIGNETNRLGSHAQGQQSIDSNGSAATLQMTKHNSPSLLAGALAYQLSHLFTYAAQFGVARVGIAALAKYHRAAHRFGALCDDHNRKMATTLLALTDLGTDRLGPERKLR